MTFTQEFFLVALGAGLGLSGAVIGAYLQHRLGLQRLMLQRDLELLKELRDQLTLVRVEDPTTIGRAIEAWDRLNSQTCDRRAALDAAWSRSRLGTGAGLTLFVAASALSLRMFADELSGLYVAVIEALRTVLGGPNILSP